MPTRNASIKVRVVRISVITEHEDYFFVKLYYDNGKSVYIPILKYE